MFTSKRQKKSDTYVVIGGGIAGVCCAQELSRIGNGHVVIISASETLVEVS
jgi:glycine/D-amino acid oxidase-like deaminating enzyme